MDEKTKKEWQAAGITVTDFEGAERQDTEYWASLTIEQRWSELEKLRQIVYGYNPATTPFRRTLEIAQLPWS
jgi:hypothetical protein